MVMVIGGRVAKYDCSWLVKGVKVRVVGIGGIGREGRGSPSVKYEYSWLVPPPPASLPSY